MRVRIRALGRRWCCESPSMNLAPRASGIVIQLAPPIKFCTDYPSCCRVKLRIHTHTLIAPPQFPRHGTQHNGIQSTAEAMAVVTTFHPHLLRWGAVPVRHRCRDVRTAGPGAWHLRHGLYVSTSPMLHSQISLTEPPPTVCMVCDDHRSRFIFSLR